MIMKGYRAVLVVMPTGEGKSPLYQLPAFSSLGGQNIFVVPYIALMVDIQQRQD